MVTVRILSQEERRQGLGATDIAGIVGVSPFSTPISVYLDKVEDQPERQTWRMRMGQLLEDAIADAYAEKYHRRLRRRGVVFHSQFPFLYCHVDRLVVGEPGIVEIKTVAFRTRWADGVPADVKVQVQWQMHVLDRSWTDVVVMSSPQDIEPFRIERDRELGAWLEQEAHAFWFDHIVPRVPPPIDASAAYRRYLRDKYPHEDIDTERAATPEEELLLEELEAARAAVTRSKDHKALLENRLIDRLGRIERLTSPIATVTYRTQQGSTYEVTRPAGRVLRVHFTKGA